MNPECFVDIEPSWLGTSIAISWTLMTVNVAPEDKISSRLKDLEKCIGQMSVILHWSLYAHEWGLTFP